jgi:alkylation response protein AidB-like acyl-CoA dehydrogenase
VTNPEYVDDLDAFRAGFAHWLDDNEPLLATQRHVHARAFGEVARAQGVLQAALFDAGWVRYGWPEAIGGFGGDARHRGSVYDVLATRQVPLPEPYWLLETLLPMLSVYGPELARQHLAPLLRGDELWCQGFSEPDAGSDLASLRTRAERDGDAWVINGRKIWTSQATAARRCIALVRTGSTESRHRGLSMFLVDLDTPGVSVRPIHAMTGRDEFGEVTFEDVHVGGDRMVGEEGAGWSVAMYLLQWERGMYPWQRQASLLTVLDRLLDGQRDEIDLGDLADAYLAIVPMRLSARNTIRRLAAGENPGPEVSVDKVLLARAELAVHDLARDARAASLELGDDDDDDVWRQEYLYSRPAPIYGGSIEIQRSILADRVLGLPRG